MAAYCRVSTKQEEQLNSYDVQMKYYTDKINGEPTWCLAGIYADKGITGTSTKRRDEFNKMIRACKKRKIDMILTKSISRFARNTVDCLRYVRLLKEIGVDVYFEEQGIHSTDPGAEFYITIHGSIAQTESENISANVRWGKAQSAKEGNVTFSYKSFLGYRKGDDGNPEIIPEEAEIVRMIYNKYLAGNSIGAIAAMLTQMGIPTPMDKEKWANSTVQSILTNEKYKGDALLQKTFINDCISKKVKTNNGIRTQYYVENNHPAIIDTSTFNQVQEEMARRAGKRKVSKAGKTAQGKYSSKYALTELLICGHCGTPYRRCTWTHHGLNRKVWRCINRIDYGKRYCKDSITVDESMLQEAIMDVIMNTARQNADILKTLKLHIGMGLEAGCSEDKSLDIQIRIAQIEAEFKKLINDVTSENHNNLLKNTHIQELFAEKRVLENQLEQYSASQEKRKNAKSRLDEIFTILNGLKNHPMTYDDQIIRQILECVIVESSEKIKVVFIGGYEAEAIL